MHCSPHRVVVSCWRRGLEVSLDILHLVAPNSTIALNASVNAGPCQSPMPVQSKHRLAGRTRYSRWHYGLRFAALVLLIVSSVSQLDSRASWSDGLNIVVAPNPNRRCVRERVELRLERTHWLRLAETQTVQRICHSLQVPPDVQTGMIVNWRPNQVSDGSVTDWPRDLNTFVKFLCDNPGRDCGVRRAAGLDSNSNQRILVRS